MPSPDRTRQRREAILDAALEVFAAKGYHGAGIADIAAVVGMGHGTFYRYFRNKRDIFTALLGEATQRIAKALNGLPPTTNSLAEYEQQLNGIAAGIFNVFSADPRLGRVVLFEAPGVDPELHEQFQSTLGVVASMTRAYLDNGVKKGFLRADMDTQLIARAVNAVIFEGMREISLSKDPQAESQRWIRQGVPQMLYGVAASR